MAKKYQFTKEPKPGEWGDFETEDGFKCFADKRARAVSWYVSWLKKKKIDNKQNHD